MSVRVALGGAAALAYLVASCSLMGLDEYDLQPCEPYEPCLELNAGLPSGQCEEYVCAESGLGCVLQARDRDQDGHADADACAARDDLGDLDCDDEPGDDSTLRWFGHAEHCDGIDNDCDGWIDEGAAFTNEQAAEHLVDDGETGISSAAADDGTTYVALSGDGHANTLLQLSGSEIEDRNPFEAGPSCELLGGDSEQCVFSELAVAATDALLFGAAIHRSGCLAGQLRVAVRPEPSPYLGLADPPEASNLRFGVDIDPESAGSCTRSSACVGASRPALAVLPAVGDAPAQGVLVWLSPRAADCGEDDACRACPDTGVADLFGIGLWVETDENGPFLLGTNDGRSAAFGESTIDSPALAAFDGGYLLAHASRDRIELRFLPRLETSGASLLARERSGGLDIAGARHVALTFDPASSSHARGLALAWRDAAPGGRTLRVAPLAFDRGADPAFVPARDPIAIETEAPVRRGPLLVYSRQGFAVSQPGNRSGGWLVTWVEGDADGGIERLMAARIAESEGRRLGRPFQIAQGTFRALFAPPREASDDTSFGIGYVAEGKLHVDRLRCPPR